MDEQVQPNRFKIFSNQRNGVCKQREQSLIFLSKLSFPKKGMENTIFHDIVIQFKHKNASNLFLA